MHAASRGNYDERTKMDAAGVTVRRDWRRSLGLPLLIVAAILIADQSAKWLVTRALGPEQLTHRHELLGSVLAIDYVENTGAAFGVLQGQTGVLTAVALFVLIGLIVSYRRVPDPSFFLTVGLGLLLGGALGNLLDRVRLGYVVDFVAVGIWPKFNVADSAITIGVLLLAVQFWRGETMREEPAPNAVNQEAILDGDQ
ncbi:MAG TPA: signal peptidase II [Thermomicrobiales bacterium]|nr:signal peptidase II [Thermomicrobiales bacterium]